LNKNPATTLFFVTTQKASLKRYLVGSLYGVQKMLSIDQPFIGLSARDKP